MIPPNHQSPITNRQPAWLPPGQTPTDRFRITGEKAPTDAALDTANWRLIIDGLVGTPLELTLDEVYTLSEYEITTDIHCVTGWSYRAMRFTGFPLAHLLNRVGPKQEAGFVWFGAYSARHHDTSLPLDIARLETWLVTHADGRPLDVEHGFPVRTLTPARYLYKSLKWVHRITLLAEDRPGFWERTSLYHHNADPWPGDQRYETGTMTPRAIEKLKHSKSFDRYRDKVIISINLSGWKPLSAEMHGLQLKNCNLRGADLSGADLSGANLTNSDLRDANLKDVNLRNADLEGANFAGADMTGADLSGANLNVVRFFEIDENGGVHGAKVRNLKWRDAMELYPDQKSYIMNNI